MRTAAFFDPLQTFPVFNPLPRRTIMALCRQPPAGRIVALFSDYDHPHSVRGDEIRYSSFGIHCVVYVETENVNAIFEIDAYVNFAIDKAVYYKVVEIP